MKAYPPIYKDVPNFNAHVFDKVDGSNLRFEYSKKRGWYKYGTRSRLFDDTDLVFGEAVALFKQELEQPLTKICIDNRFEKAIAFAEFAGPHSFAGQHIQESHTLYLFDIWIYKKGLLSPKTFIKLTKDIKTPSYLGYFRWNEEFVHKVWSAEIPGITFEGVVGKDGEYDSITMAKAKTKQWINKVHELYHQEAESIINS